MRFSRERLFRTRICPPVKCRECNCRAYCAEIVALALHYAWSTAPKFVTLPPLLRPSSSDTLPSSPIFPALITCMYAGRHTWPPDKARNLPPSSRRFSNTAASSGTAGRERWRIWAWPCQCLAIENFSRTRAVRRCRPRPALAAYKDFLTLWKDADPDVSILKQAKAEYESCADGVQSQLVEPRAPRPCGFRTSRRSRQSAQLGRIKKVIVGPSRRFKLRSPVKLARHDSCCHVGGTRAPP